MVKPGQEEVTKTDSADREEVQEARPETAMDLPRALQIKRWEVHEGPFQGFNSPPGRF